MNIIKIIKKENMKYKVGDKVRIVSKKIGGSWNHKGEMDKWLGEVMTIKDDYGHYYGMEEDNNVWSWYHHMIEGPAPKTLNTLQVGDILVDKDDDEVKVLAVTGELIGVSEYNMFGKRGNWHTAGDLAYRGFTIQSQKEVEEMTIKDAEEALSKSMGKTVKIVK